MDSSLNDQSRFIAAARKFKHAIYLARRRERQQRAILGARFYDVVDHLRPFSWRPERYGDAFFAQTPAAPLIDPADVSNRIWLVWSGTNPITPNRRAALDQISSNNSDVRCTLVTPDNLHEFEHPTRPIHPGYEFLSLTHRSDYLKCYLLYHYGGAYSDLKNFAMKISDVLPVFRSKDIWFATYPEPVTGLAAPLSGPIGRDVKVHRRWLPGQAVIVSRPGTPLLAEWLSEIERRLDEHLSELADHPGGIYGRGAPGTPASNPEYPLAWNDLCSTIYHPLGLKYRGHIHYEPRLYPDRTNYR